jgi:TetR/AcrR family transcriptional regulator, regulator of autoinduction and epiphytic fitness
LLGILIVDLPQSSGSRVDGSLDAVSVLGAPQHDLPSSQGDEVRSRREQGRVAILDAMLALHLDGNLNPSAEEITKEAGLESGAIFLHFDNNDDLQQAAITRHRNRVLPLVAIEPGPESALGERVAALVAQRKRLLETYGPVGMMARLQAPSQPLIQEELVRTRAFLRYQLKGLFGRELAAMSSHRAETTLTAIDVLCSFESYRLMQAEHGLSAEDAAHVVTTALMTLLTSTHS